MTGSSYTGGVKREVYGSFLHKKICLKACTSQGESEEIYLPALFFFFPFKPLFPSGKEKETLKGCLTAV